MEDNGPGIDAADLPLIFEKFYRGKRGAEQGKGSGMGLAITRAILLAHGGGIEASSVPGGGARFRSGCRWWRRSRAGSKRADLSRMTMTSLFRLVAPVAGNFAALLGAFHGPLQQPRHAPAVDAGRLAPELCPAAHRECPRSRAGSRRGAPGRGG